MPCTHTIGIDVGGTKIVAGLVAFPAGRVVSRRQIKTAPERGGPKILEEVEGLARDLMEGSFGVLVSGIGVGLCELVDLTGNVVSQNCVPWQGLPVRQTLSKLAPTMMDADVRTAALGEALFGAGRGFKQFLYVTVGTGISCSLVIDGQPFKGAHGLTGTMASSPLPVAEGAKDFVIPTLEQLAAGPGLVRRHNERGIHQAISAEEVVAAAARGDVHALSIVESAGHALGAVVGGLINVLDPEAVIVGGGLGLSGGHYWNSFVQSARRHIWSELHRDLPIQRAATGPDAGLIGAAAAVWQRISAVPPAAPPSV